MIELLGLLGFGSFLAVSLVLGLRLLALARRTRLLPEWAMGLNFLLAGFVGYGLLLASESLRLVPEPWDRFGSFVGVTSISAGALFVGLFTARVFRPGRRSAQIALAALAAWLVLGIAGSWWLHVAGVDAGARGWLGRWAPNVGLLVAYAWASAEPLHYQRALRRRARMGLAPADVAIRMLLWGAGSLAIAAIAAVHLAAQLAGRYELPPALVGLVSLLALGTAIAEWLAFFPSRAARRLRSAAAP